MKNKYSLFHCLLLKTVKKPKILHKTSVTHITSYSKTHVEKRPRQLFSQLSDGSFSSILLSLLRLLCLLFLVFRGGVRDTF